VPREELYGVMVRTTSPTFARIVQRLARRPGLAVTRDDMVEHLWGDAPDGGPLQARQLILKAIYEHGDKLEQYGWRLHRRPGGWGDWIEAIDI